MAKWPARRVRRARPVHTRDILPMHLHVHARGEVGAIPDGVLRGHCDNGHARKNPRKIIGKPIFTYVF